MLTVSIGTWAVPNIGYENGTAYLTGFSAGQLSIILSDGTIDGMIGSVDNLKSATKIYFGDDNASVTLNAQDLEALSKTNATQLDMAKAVLADGTSISSLKSNAEYVELPFGTYTKDDLSGLSTNNTNLKFAAALTSKGAPEDYTGYSYKAGNLKNFSDQGLMSVSDLSNSSTTVTLYGELNSTDLGNINNVLNVHQKVTDISEATVADLTDVSGIMDSNQFLIIPQTISTSWNDEWPNYSLSSTSGYPHFGFYTDANKKKLCVHTGDATETVGSDLANLYDFVDKTMTLSVLPNMKADGTFQSWINGNNNESCKNNYLVALKDLKLGCLDMSWFNQSGIGTDYSTFTNVDHLIVPCNSNTNDLASTYTVPNNIKTIADYSSTADNAGNEFVMGGQTYSVGTKKATAVFVKSAGSLGEAHKLWPSRMFDIDDYYLAGQINNTDVAALSNQAEGSEYPQVPATMVDMHHAYMSGSELMSGYANSYVKYLALPDGQGATINATSATSCAYYPACTNLKCVAGYNPSEDKLYTFSTEVGTINTLTSLMYPNPNSSRYGVNPCSGLKNVVMSGQLNHDDINLTTNQGNSNYGLGGAAVETADLNWAVFPNQDDMCFNTAGGWEKLNSITLPVTSQTKLPDSCFDNCQQLPEVCIPGTYQEIGAYAFRNCGMLTHVYTTLVSSDTGFTNDNGANTLTLPPSLTKISTGAFSNVKWFTDVYITTPTTSPAPECAQDAFDGITYWGNNTTFDGGRGWSRVRKTENGVITAALAYLHWPATDGDRNLVYTDITRNYSIKALDTVTDVNGEVIYFPSQAEMVRSFVQGKFGYTWEAWGTERNTYTSSTSDTPPVVYYDIKNPTGLEAGSTQSAVDAASDASYTFDNRYLGWHQFVLSANFAYSPRINLAGYKENDWYTICMPYDLTKEELLTLFGAQYEEGKETKVDGVVLSAGEKKYPKVVTLTGAKRDKENEIIYLHLSKDLLGNNVQWNFDNFSNYEASYLGGAKGQKNAKTIAQNHTENDQYIAQTNDVVIMAGYPYLIKPYLSDEDLASAQAGYRGVVFDKTSTAAEPYYTYRVVATNGETGTNGNIVDRSDNEISPDNASADDLNLFTYHFMGTLEKRTGGIPQNAYYLGKAKSGGKHKFFRHTSSSAKNWTKNACIILANLEAPSYGQHRASESIYTWYWKVDWTKAQDDSFTDAAGAKVSNYSFDFDESELIEDSGMATGIDEVNTSETKIINDGKVYNANGQYVGNSLKGLSKGMYIVNGKKFIVK